MKSIFEYDNYRLYLKDYYSYQKSAHKKFSFRYFARLAGCQSSATLKRVMDGQRNLTDDLVEKFAKALKLKKEEALFFEKLVAFNQARTSEEKQYYAKLLLGFKAYQKIHPLTEAQFNFYLHWYFPVIRELICLPDFQEDPAWISKHLEPEISPSEAKVAIDELIKLGLVKRNAKGRLVQTHTIISTQDEVSSASIAHHHREMMKNAGDSIDRVARENRLIMGQTLGVSHQGAQKIKAMVQKFRQEIFEVVSNEESVEVIYQLNFQLFPVMKQLRRRGVK